MSISYRQTLHASGGSPYLTTTKIADPHREAMATCNGNSTWCDEANRMIAFIEYNYIYKILII
jgi:hypothetical protein